MSLACACRRMARLSRSARTASNAALQCTWSAPVPPDVGEARTGTGDTRCCNRSRGGVCGVCFKRRPLLQRLSVPVLFSSKSERPNSELSSPPPPSPSVLLWLNDSLRECRRELRRVNSCSKVCTFPACSFAKRAFCCRACVRRTPRCLLISTCRSNAFRTKPSAMTTS
jgi:hypothetical protein